MSCQIGIYESPDDSIDQWNSLVYLQDPQPPRDLLRHLIPFLRQFHTLHDMSDAGSLGAWLTWLLIETRSTATTDLQRISLSREIRTDIDYFLRISPGQVEVYSIDEILEWRIIAAVEIPRQTVEVETS